MFCDFLGRYKRCFLSSCRATKLKNQLSVSKRLGIIKLGAKKDEDKRSINSWCPTSLLNVDYKFFSKALASRLKKALPNLISLQQTAYFKNSCIGEGGRLIADMNEINKEKFLVTMSLDHTCVISVSKSLVLVVILIVRLKP